MPHNFLNDFRVYSLVRKESSASVRHLFSTSGSVLAQKGASTVVIQKLLEHSSPELANKVYTNVDPVLRKAVDQIPVGDWLHLL
jgi:site-specific recombinase XerD